MHRSTNVIYSSQYDRSLIGRHNKRGQQVNIPMSTKNSKLTDQSYINKKTDTKPVHYDHVQTSGYKRHGNTVHSIHSMHSLAGATKFGIGVVVPQRAKDTRTQYFENKVNV